MTTQKQTVNIYGCDVYSTHDLDITVNIKDLEKIREELRVKYKAKNVFLKYREQWVKKLNL